MCLKVLTAKDSKVVLKAFGIEYEIVKKLSLHAIFIAKNAQMTILYIKFLESALSAKSARRKIFVHTWPFLHIHLPRRNRKNSKIID